MAIVKAVTEEARASDPATVAKALGLQIVEADRKMTIDNPVMKAITE